MITNDSLFLGEWGRGASKKEKEMETAEKNNNNILAPSKAFGESWLLPAVA